MIVHAPSYTFFIFNAVTIVLTYAKLEGDLFFFTWKMTLTPTLLYLFLLSLKYLKRIVIIDEGTYKECYSLKTNKFQLIDNFFHMIFSLLLLFFIGYIVHQIDLEAPQFNKQPLYFTISLYLFLQFLYSYISKSIEHESFLPFPNKDNSVLSAIMSPILNFLGSSFVLCSTGSCSSIYGSTISAIFSAFGISVSEWLPYLDWLTFLLVLISVFVLYYAKKSLTYKPFLLSCVAGILIFADTLVFQKKYPLYLGNVLMIAAAIWNSRLNKARMSFGFTPIKTKQAPTAATASN